MAPPRVVVRQLNELLESVLAAGDDRITDTYELMRRARDARENEQHDRAESLARRFIALEPGNDAGAGEFVIRGGWPGGLKWADDYWIF